MPARLVAVIIPLGKTASWEGSTDPPARKHRGNTSVGRRVQGKARGRTLGAFCSLECFLAHVKTGEWVTCPACGAKRYRSPSHAHKR
jgi:hypothetical protein